MKKLMLPPTLQEGANIPTHQVGASMPIHKNGTSTLTLQDGASVPVHQDGAPKRQPGYEFLKRFLMHLAFLYSENV